MVIKIASRRRANKNNKKKKDHSEYATKQKCRHAYIPKKHACMEPYDIYITGLLTFVMQWLRCFNDRRSNVNRDSARAHVSRGDNAVECSRTDPDKFLALCLTDFCEGRILGRAEVATSDHNRDATLYRHYFW